jgi:MinD-like ATPase involved in chromosome partitioning or flagellar assembly
MARVFFVSGGKGGVRKSVGAIALLDYFQMGSRRLVGGRFDVVSGT